jgi:hypothetical protein
MSDIKIGSLNKDGCYEPQSTIHVGDESEAPEPAIVLCVGASKGSNVYVLPTLPPAPTLVPSILLEAAHCDQISEFLANFLQALPEGSWVTFSTDQLEFLFPADDFFSSTENLYTVIEQVASKCGCFFNLEREAGLAIFSKDRQIG